jgi:malate dehydrogenase
VLFLFLLSVTFVSFVVKTFDIFVRQGTWIMKKVSVIGAGNVGATAVYYIAEKNIADIVMVDVVKDLARNKALDFMHSAALRSYNVSITGSDDFSDIRDSDVVVVTAGVPRKPGMDRMDLLKVNVAIAKTAAQKIAEHAPSAVVIVVTNPLDVIAMVVLRETGFALKKVVGMAGALDSTRFRYFIAEKFGVWPGDVTAMVLGGHGDEMVPLKNYTSVGGIPLAQLLDDTSIEAMIKRTRDGGAEIVRYLKTGSAFYAPGASAAAMVEAVIKDEKRLMAASAFLRGEYGYNGIFLGVPVLLGKNGVERIVNIDLSADEKKALDKSAAAVREGITMLESFYTPG